MKEEKEEFVLKSAAAADWVGLLKRNMTQETKSSYVDDVERKDAGISPANRVTQVCLRDNLDQEGNELAPQGGKRVEETKTKPTNKPKRKPGDGRVDKSGLCIENISF